MSRPLAGRPLLFVGNGPYRNRGCEAIVRGTMHILEGAFGAEMRVRAGVMAQPSTVEEQQVREIDPRLTSYPVSHLGPRFSAKWWMSQINSRLGTTLPSHVRDLRNLTPGVACALQLGGDNYSLDYGRPWNFIQMDRYLARAGIPTVIWGASVGPFDSDPKFAPVIHAHLKTLAGIFVRETASQDYLAAQGISDNVHLMADPAFCMPPSQPPGRVIRDLVMEGMIGINLSPLVARFLESGSSLESWRAKSAEMIVAAAKRTSRPILLVPHVGSPEYDEDDFAFATSLREMVAARVQVPVKTATKQMNAAELKWLIARCVAFAGARTHATIAALSSCVPTLSISYSLKALGLNRDIFDHQHFCKSVKTITPSGFADAFESMLSEQNAIRAKLGSTIPKMKARAHSAGALLADLIDGE